MKSAFRNDSDCHLPLCRPWILLTGEYVIMLGFSSQLYRVLFRSEGKKNLRLLQDDLYIIIYLARQKNLHLVYPPIWRRQTAPSVKNTYFRTPPRFDKMPNFLTFVDSLEHAENFLSAKQRLL